MIRVERVSQVGDCSAGAGVGAGAGAGAGLDTSSESGDSGASGDEVPVWVRGEQRWVSGVDRCTTCLDLKVALLQDEANKGKTVGEPEQYHITERWRGVEQPLDDSAAILDIWNAWGNAQSEVKLSLRRVTHTEGNHRRRRHHRAESTCSTNVSDRRQTLHPRRLFALATSPGCGGSNSTSKYPPPPSDTEELLKLVLAQGEIIRKQLRRLRHSENQIGYLEDKTHRARVKKHGSNYLLETYLRGLADASEVADEETPLADSPVASNDKNSDSGVMTENDSGEPTTSTQNPFDRLSPSYSDSKEDETSANEEITKDHIDAYEMLHKINKKLLKEEEKLVRLHISIKKYERNKNDLEQIEKTLNDLRTEMTKSSNEMQQNAIILDETNEIIDSRRLFLNELHKEILRADHEHEMLTSMKISQDLKRPSTSYNHYYPPYTKELNTLV